VNRNKWNPVFGYRVHRLIAHGSGKLWRCATSRNERLKVVESLFCNLTPGSANAACQRDRSFDTPGHVSYFIAHEKNLLLHRARLCPGNNRQQEQRRIGRATALRSITNIDSEHAPPAPLIVGAPVCRFDPKAFAKNVLYSKTFNLS